MIVDQFSSPLTGGAAIAARRLHDALNEQSIDSRFWYLQRGRQSPPNQSYRPLNSLQVGSLANQIGFRLRRAHHKRLTKHAVKGRPVGFEMFSNPAGGWKVRHAGNFEGDIVHLHWFGDRFDYPSLIASIPSSVPIVWTLHDMSAFTGGCHYTDGCEAYQSACGQCPQLGKQRDNDLSSQVFRVKQDAFRGKNLHIVAVGKELEQQARNAALLKDAVSFQTIHCGLETDVWKPQEKLSARESFQLPSDAVVIGFGATNVQNHRKGLRELSAALAQLKTQRRVIGLVFGDGQIPNECQERIELRNIGFVSQQADLTRMYSAIDFFAMPSLEEAFGMTGLEAMACGAPVVAFGAGGIRDYVRPGVTGLLADVGNVQQLARQTDWMIEHESERSAMGKKAREMVVAEFDFSCQAAEYIHVYERALARWSGDSKAAA